MSLLLSRISCDTVRGPHQRLIGDKRRPFGTSAYHLTSVRFKPYLTHQALGVTCASSSPLSVNNGDMMCALNHPRSAATTEPAVAFSTSAVIGSDSEYSSHRASSQTMQA